MPPRLSKLSHTSIGHGGWCNSAHHNMFISTERQQRCRAKVTRGLTSHNERYKTGKTAQNCRARTHASQQVTVSVTNALGSHIMKNEKRLPFMPSLPKTPLPETRSTCIQACFDCFDDLRDESVVGSHFKGAAAHKNALPVLVRLHSGWQHLQHMPLPQQQEKHAL